MKIVGILPNVDKDLNLSHTKEIVQYLLSKGLTPLLPEHTAASITMLKYAADSQEELFRNSDFMIVLGGDGTLLGAAKKAAVYETPLLGINLGNLGFLTDEEVGDFSLSIDRILEGGYKIEKRMLLEAAFETKSSMPEGFLALNDVCISRGVFSKIVDLHVYVNGEYLDTYRADGVIITTPTGSTAYNLSAGGPILKPTSEIVAITPICPHALGARSIVISATDDVMVEIDKKSRGDLLVSLDGQTGAVLVPGAKVLIKRSKNSVSIMKTNNRGFYDVLRQKLVMKGES